MKVVYSSIEALFLGIKTEKRKFVIYGAGMIGISVIPHFIYENEVLDLFLGYIDRDFRKINSKIEVSGQYYEIHSVDYFKTLDKNVIIIISNSNYSGVLQSLNDIPFIAKNESYLFPVMLEIKSRNISYICKHRLSDEPLIPKKIHYCWFSKKSIPDHLLYCIDSWHKKCPDYEIIRWDENNYNVFQNEYMKQAYIAQKWSFVTDYARLDILYKHGGIYLDTDVELLKSLDELLYQRGFVGVEKWGNINTGGGCGAVKNNPVIKKMLDQRETELFKFADGSLNMTTCGYYETKALATYGFVPNNTLWRNDDITVYPSDMFHPYDYMSNESVITDNTVSYHHFNGNWMDKEAVKERNESRNKYKELLKDIGAVND